jgi:hypothetical protein
MKPAPSILRRVPLKLGSPKVQAPVQRLLDHPRPGSFLSAMQLRTRHLMDYLAVTLLKTW